MVLLFSCLQQERNHALLQHATMCFYEEVNKNGVNLFPGDVNMEFLLLWLFAQHTGCSTSRGPWHLSLLFASPHRGIQKLTSPWRCLSLKDVCHSSEVCVCLRASQTPQLLLDWWLRCHSYAHKLTLALNHIQLYCKVHIGACITCEPKVFTNAVSRECHPHPNPYKKYTKYMDFLLVL